MQEKHNNHHTHTRTHSQKDTQRVSVGQLGDRSTIISKVMAVTTLCCMLQFTALLPKTLTIY